MNTQLFARIYGIVFLIVGIGGFIPGLTQPHEHPGLIINGSSGMELGLFPVMCCITPCTSCSVCGDWSRRAVSPVRCYTRARSR